MVIQQRNKILWEKSLQKREKYWEAMDTKLVVAINQLIKQTSQSMDKCTNNSHQNQQEEFLLWILCFRESQTQKFIEYKAHRPSVIWDPAFVTCDPKHLRLCLISCKPERNGCLSYISWNERWLHANAMKFCGMYSCWYLT